MPRLWAFLAVGLPVAGRCHRQPPERGSHLPAAGRARRSSPVAGSRRPTRGRSRRSAQPWTDQQWGAQVILAAVYQLGAWTGLVAVPGRADRASSSGACSSSAGDAGSSPATRRSWRLAAFLVAAVALALRPQLIGMALLRDRPGAGHRPARTSRATVGDPVHRPGLGQHPRQLLPRAGRPRSGLAGGSSTIACHTRIGCWSWPWSRSRRHA